MRRIAWVRDTDRTGLNLGPFGLQPGWVPLDFMCLVRLKHFQSQVGMPSVSVTA